jgi:hypothetical protein
MGDYGLRGGALLMRFRFPRPLHGWRALAGEIGVIVVGVLIALTAEQAVQQWHDHSDMREAQQQMFLEMRDDNLPQAFTRVAIAPCLDAELSAIAAGANKRLSREAINRLVSDFEPPVRTWDSEAYDSAIASGALKPGGPQELMRWAAFYRILPILRAAGAQEDELIGNLAVLQDRELPLTVDERSNLVRTSRHLQRANRAMSTVGELVIQLSKSAGVEMTASNRTSILNELREAYGPCVRDPAQVRSVSDEEQLSVPELEKLRGRVARERAASPKTS